MKLRSAILTLLTVLCLCPLRAERFVTVRSLSSEDPAIQGAIYDIMQDHEGFIWFSTFNGLHRYDGIDIVKYKPQVGSSAMPNRINMIFENALGDIWCWCDGLYLFERRKESFLDLTALTRIYGLDPDDRLMGVNNEIVEGSSVLLLSSGLCLRVSCTDPLHDHGRWTQGWQPPVRPQWSYPQLDSRAYYTRDQEGTYWGLTEKGDLFHYSQEKQSYQYYTHIELEPDGSTIVRPDRQGNFWLRRNHSLDCVSLHTTPFEFSAPGGDASELRCMMTDRQGRLWMAFKNGCIHLQDSLGRSLGYLKPSGGWSEKPVPFGSAVYAMLEDAEGGVWLGSRYDGLFFLQPGQGGKDYKLTHYIHEEGEDFSLLSNHVFDLCQDHRGQIWVATFGGGVQLFRNGLFFHMNNRLAADAQVLPRNVRSITEVGQDTMVACSKEGLFTWNADFSRVESIAFYASTKSGKPEDLSDTDVMQFFRARNGERYVVTHSGGICRVLSDNLLRDQLPFQTMDSHSGLASDATLCMTDDEQGRLWIASYNALSCLDRDEVLVFSGNSFSHRVLFSEARPLRRGGELLFGTLDGLLRFAPQSIEKSRFFYPLVFSGLMIENKPAYGRIDPSGHLRLASNERNITLSYAAIDFSGESSVRYSYWLEGVDHEWIQTSRNSITWLRLPPGTHTFHLKSTNSDGLWSQEELRLIITVAPTFVESPWGRTIIGLGLVALFLVGLFVYHRFYKLRQGLEMEREMTDIKLRFFTDVSHELRTPLTLIDGPVSEALADESIQGKSRRHLETVQKNARHMLNLVNQILDFRKIQNNKMTVILEYLPIAGVIRGVMDNFMELAAEHHIDFSLRELSDPASAPLMLWMDRDKIEKICFNLLSNAFKYTPDGKSVSIEIEDSPQEVSILFSDEGNGIDPKQIDLIFKRFGTIERDNLSKPSSGIGLSLVKNYADLHHGRISVVSVPGEGSCFTLTLRKGREHFSQDDNVQMVAADTETHPQNGAAQSKYAATESDWSKSSDVPLILVVEDNVELRSFICEILQDSYQTVEASNGVEGLEKARQYWPSLIISDVMMPQMDGFELVEKIRADMDLYPVPVILLTAKTQIDDRVKGMDLGADDYIIKPFSAKYLKARVENLLLQQQRFKRYLLSRLETSADVQQPAAGNTQTLTEADQLFIRDIQSFMEKNIDNTEITINDVARALYMGRTRFNRKIKQLFDLTPVNFIQTMRLQRARQLLLNRNYNISEVAYRTGFSDPKYFTRCFKKFYGMTPREFQTGSTLTNPE